MILLWKPESTKNDEDSSSSVFDIALRRDISLLIPRIPLCLKFTEKVSFNIASEASYVYILSGQRLIKNAKNGPFWRVFENLKLPVKQSYHTCQF